MYTANRVGLKEHPLKSHWLPNTRIMSTNLLFIIHELMPTLKFRHQYHSVKNTFKHMNCLNEPCCHNYFVSFAPKLALSIWHLRVLTLIKILFAVNPLQVPVKLSGDCLLLCHIIKYSIWSMVETF